MKTMLKWLVGLLLLCGLGLGIYSLNQNLIILEILVLYVFLNLFEKDSQAPSVYQWALHLVGFILFPLLAWLSYSGGNLLAFASAVLCWLTAIVNLYRYYILRRK